MLKQIKCWLQAIRPKTLFIGFCPVLIGSSLAYHTNYLHLPSALACLFSALFIQIGTNLANDYYDFIKGADNIDRKGPKRMTQSGAISPKAMQIGFILSFLMAALFGLYLVYRGGMPILVIGIFSIICGILYTAGPFPLGYIGIADIFAFLFFGPIAVGGTYYVQTLSINPNVIIAGLTPGFFSVAVLTVNNIRDIESDKKAGKKSLAVRFGKKFAIFEYVLSIMLALLVPIYFVLTNIAGPGLLATLIIGFLILPYIKILFNKSGSVLNKVLERTAQSLLIYSILFVLGW